LAGPASAWEPVATDRRKEGMPTTMSARAVRAESEGRSGWGWWVALGVLLLIAGLLALGNLLIATAASVFFVGAMMIVGGIAEIVFAFSYWGRWGRFIMWLLLGALYLAAGVVTFRNPALATAVLTLVLAASLVAVGILKIGAGIASRPAEGPGLARRFRRANRDRRRDHRHRLAGD